MNLSGLTNIIDKGCNPIKVSYEMPQIKTFF